MWASPRHTRAATLRSTRLPPLWGLGQDLGYEEMLLYILFCKATNTCEEFSLSLSLSLSPSLSLSSPRTPLPPAAGSVKSNKKISSARTVWVAAHHRPRRAAMTSVIPGTISGLRSAKICQI